MNRLRRVTQVSKNGLNATRLHFIVIGARLADAIRSYRSRPTRKRLPEGLPEWKPVAEQEQCDTARMHARNLSAPVYHIDFLQPES